MAFHGLQALINGFFHEKGVSPESVGSSLSVEWLAEMFERYVGHQDQRALMNAEGMVGVIFTFIFALPEPAHMIAFPLIAEMIKRSRRIPPPVKVVLAAAFKSVSPGIVDGAERQGITPAELAEAQARSSAKIAATKDEVIARVRRMLSGAEPIPKDEPETNSGAASLPEDTHMDTKPSRAGQPPTGLTAGQTLAYEAWNLIFALRLCRKKEIIEQPGKRRQLKRALLALEPDAKAYKLLPEMTAGQRADVETHVKRLWKDIDPDPKNRPTEDEMKDSVEVVLDTLGPFAPFADAAIEEGLTNVSAKDRGSLDAADWVDDHLFTNRARETVAWGWHAIFGPREAPAAPPASPPPPPSGGDGSEPPAEPPTPPAKPGLGMRTWSFAKWVGTIILALMAIVFIGGGLLIVSTVLSVVFGLWRFLFGGKKDGEKKPGLTFADLIGFPIYWGSLAVGTAQLAAWLAEPFQFVEERPEWFNPFVFCGALFGVWVAKFIILSHEGWDLDQLERKELEEKEKREKDGKKGKPDDHAAHPEPVTTTALVVHKKDDKHHGKDHAPEVSALDLAILERKKKRLLVVPGERRPGVLKVSMGAMLVGFVITAAFALNGDVAFGYAMIVCGFYMLLTILDAGQYFNLSLPFEFMQNFLVRQVFAKALYPIVGCIAIGFVVIVGFSSQAQIQVVGKIHDKTDQWLGVTDDDGESAGSQETAAKPKPAQQTYASASADPKPRSCPDRDRLEAQSKGFCSRKPDYVGCQCP